MLQNNPVRNLQYESDLRIAQQIRIDPPVFEGNTIISVRPHRSSISVPRIPLPMPISTLQQYEGEIFSSNRTFLPISGLDILHDMPSLHIEQTFELNETLTSITSENRYTIRSPLGDALFAGTESSINNYRKFLNAASRSFQMYLLDKTHQNVLTLQKKFALGGLCCQPRKLEIWAPPGDLLGTIIEVPSIFSNKFTIQNDHNEILYQIEGPNTLSNCCMPIEAHFRIFSADMNILKGSIVRIWSTQISQYTLNIYFNDINLSVKSKALYLGAAFLIEYMYFQSTS